MSKNCRMEQNTQTIKVDKQIHNQAISHIIPVERLI
jgi:hypothetical protein